LTSRIDAKKFLSFWEDSWGKLTPEWSEKFLNDPRLQEILKHPGLRILSAVQKHKKIDEIVQLLESQASQIQSKVNPDKKVIVKTSDKKRQNLGSLAERTEINDWLATMQETRFDPESTFPRLIVDSTREICEGKRAYKDEKDAILAIIELGNRKDELIKQLPYRCNVCRQFHNTHLISRETLGKLIRKYKI
jgi:hypothetical protein